MNNKDIKVAMILDKHFPPDPRVDNQCYALSKRGIKVSRFFKSISALAYTFPIYHWLMYLKLTTAIDLGKYDVLQIHDIQIAFRILDDKRQGDNDHLRPS